MTTSGIASPTDAPDSAMSTPQPRVFVVDDDRSVRKSLARLLHAEAYAVETFATATEYLARGPHDGPVCLVLDMHLPGLDGLGLQQQLAGLGRSESVVFITGHDDLPSAIQAMKLGAVDFLLKPIGDGALLAAVAQALARSGDERRQREETVKVRARIAALTPKEFEVFRFVISGLLNKQIAAALGSALRTIKRHRGCVMQKLGVASVAELVRMAQMAGVAPAQNDPKGPYTA